ncbi:hypothetical protein BKA59DRAFT_390471, partial [Fusarium tricinctum]
NYLNSKYFKVNIDLGWYKLNNYYIKLNKILIYYTLAILNLVYIKHILRIYRYID